MTDCVRRISLVVVGMLVACGGDAPAAPTEPAPAPAAVEPPPGTAEAAPPVVAPAAPAEVAVTTEVTPATAEPTAPVPSAAKPVVRAADPKAPVAPVPGTSDVKPADPIAAPVTAPPQPVVPETPVPPPIPTQWTISASKSHVFVVSRIDSSTLFSSLGHDHAIGATRFSGDVTWGEGVACAVEIVVPVSDLKVDPPGYRKMAGIDLSVDMKADDKATIEANFKGKKQLDADKYPDLRFKAKSCSGTSGSVSVTGDFTMHGVTKTITIPMKVSVDANTFKASGRFSIKGSDYGMSPFAAPMGALKNLDKLDFTIDVVGAPKG